MNVPTVQRNRSTTVPFSNPIFFLSFKSRSPIRCRYPPAARPLSVSLGRTGVHAATGRQRVSGTNSFGSQSRKWEGKSDGPGPADPHMMSGTQTHPKSHVHQFLPFFVFFIPSPPRANIGGRGWNAFRNHSRFSQEHVRPRREIINTGRFFPQYWKVSLRKACLRPTIPVAGPNQTVRQTRPVRIEHFIDNATGT